MLEPRDWDPEDARLEAKLTRASPWLAVLLVVGVVTLLVMLMMACVSFTDFMTPLLRDIDDWIATP